MTEPIDVVVTWVDDAWPGYQGLLRQYAKRPVDRNPNRTRDNLDLLKYSLRSLVHYMPWLRRVVLVTARPQIPAWLDVRAPNLQVVHHDVVFDSDDLPTFNSFAIVAHLMHIPGLSRRFLYVEDDRLLGAPVGFGDLFAPCGRPWLYAARPWTDGAQAVPSRKSNPWNAALAYSNYLLDSTYGRMRRRSIKHAPVVFDQSALHDLLARYPDAVAHTRASRFRAPGNIALEHMLPYDMWHRNLAVMHPRTEARRATAYWGLDNALWRQRLGLWHLERKRARFMCLNDNFGASPRPACVRHIRAFLDRVFPWPSPFERQGHEALAG